MWSPWLRIRGCWLVLQTEYDKRGDLVVRVDQLVPGAAANAFNGLAFVNNLHFVGLDEVRLVALSNLAEGW